MVFIVEPAGIGEMAVLTAQLRRFFVHHLREGFPGTGHMLCQGVGCLVGGLEEHGVQGIPDCEHVPLVQTGVAAAALHVVDGVVGVGHLFVQVAVFQYDKSGQHLGDAGRIIGFMKIFSEKHGSRIGVHNHAAVRFDGNVGGPVRGGVGWRREEAQNQQNAQKNREYTFHKIRKLHIKNFDRRLQSYFIQYILF